MLDAPKCDIQSQCMSQIQLGWDTYQIPLEGSCGHGGNCFGSVRIYGHFPDRAASVMREAAARSHRDRELRELLCKDLYLTR